MTHDPRVDKAALTLAAALAGATDLTDAARKARDYGLERLATLVIAAADAADAEAGIVRVRGDLKVDLFADDAAEGITIPGIQAYLTELGWTLHPDPHPAGTFWRKHPDRPWPHILVPSERDDWWRHHSGPAVCNIVGVIADVEGTGALAVLAGIRQASDRLRNDGRPVRTGE